MADVQVPVLQWPSFCYPSPVLFDDESLCRGKKRKSREEFELGSPGSQTSEEEQKVPESRNISPRNVLGSPDREPAVRSEFTFSNLMKRMAAK